MCWKCKKLKHKIHFRNQLFFLETGNWCVASASIAAFYINISFYADFRKYGDILENRQLSAGGKPSTMVIAGKTYKAGHFENEIIWAVFAFDKIPWLNTIMRELSTCAVEPDK